MTAGARTGSVMDTSVIGGNKTVLTEALQLEYTEFRHGGAGGLSESLFPSNEAVGVTAHAAGSKNMSWKHMTISPPAEANDKLNCHYSTQVPLI